MKQALPQGNIILTDAKYDVLTLLRQYRDDNNNFAMMPNHPYPVHTIRLYEPVTPEQLQASLANASEKFNLKSALISCTGAEPGVLVHSEYNLADVSVRSPRKLVILIIYERLFSGPKCPMNGYFSFKL